MMSLIRKAIPQDKALYKLQYLIKNFNQKPAQTKFVDKKTNHPNLSIECYVSE